MCCYLYDSEETGNNPAVFATAAPSVVALGNGQVVCVQDILSQDELCIDAPMCKLVKQTPSWRAEAHIL